MKSDDNRDALSSYVSGIIALAIHGRYCMFTHCSHNYYYYFYCSLLFAPLCGGLLATFIAVPMIAVVLAELFLSQVLLGLGKCKARTVGKLQPCPPPVCIHVHVHLIQHWMD